MKKKVILKCPCGEDAGLVALTSMTQMFLDGHGSSINCGKCGKNVKEWVETELDEWVLK